MVYKKKLPINLISLSDHIEKPNLDIQKCKN